MIERIVKLSFHTESISVFKTIFEQNKLKINGFKGCLMVNLLQDIHNENVFFTYSRWESESDLNAYRNSSLFKEVWSETKILFNAKPEAWSTHIISK